MLVRREIVCGGDGQFLMLVLLLPGKVNDHGHQHALPLGGTLLPSLVYPVGRFNLLGLLRQLWQFLKGFS